MVVFFHGAFCLASFLFLPGSFSLFDPGDFENRFGLDLALKDVRLGCEMAESWGNDAATMKVALDYFKKASSEGLGNKDCNAIYKVIK